MRKSSTSISLFSRMRKKTLKSQSALQEMLKASQIHPIKGCLPFLGPFNHVQKQFMLTIGPPLLRPKHGMYENMKPLFANPVLPLLAIALADRALQDYDIFEKIESIPPPEDGFLHHLRIKSEMFDIPFFRNVISNGATEKIQTATSFSKRTVALGHRAGYLENISIHDIRAEIFV